MRDRSCPVEIEDEGSGRGMRLPLVTDKYKTMKINASTSFSPPLPAGRSWSTASCEHFGNLQEKCPFGLNFGERALITLTLNLL